MTESHTKVISMEIDSNRKKFRVLFSCNQKGDVKLETDSVSGRTDCL